MFKDIAFTVDNEGYLSADGGLLMCVRGAEEHGIFSDGILRVSSEPFAGSLPVEGRWSGKDLRDLIVDGGDNKHGYAYSLMDRLVVEVLGLVDGKVVDCPVFHVGVAPKEEACAERV